MLRPKKVGTLPVGPGSDEVKQTNEIKYASILLDDIGIENKDITADALHTQAEFARYLVEQRKAHYYFCVKGNQPTLLSDIESYFEKHLGKADYEDQASLQHGRIEVRRIWTSTALNDYVNFPHVAQIYRIEREVTHKKVAKRLEQLLMASPADRLKKQAPKRFCTRYVLTGRLRSATTLLTGFMTRIVQLSG